MRVVYKDVDVVFHQAKRIDNNAGFAAVFSHFGEVIGDTYYRVEYTYDNIGNINREKYFDADGKPVRCEAGYAIVYREFDEFNRVVYEKFFDTDGFAIRLEDGAVSRRYQYDDDGNLIKMTKYDYGDHEVQ